LSRVSFTKVENPSGIVWTQLYFGLGFTTLATLILELTLTRIFSVVFYYHFAFLAISLALFGLGAGGVFSYVVSSWRGNLWARLGWLALGNSLAVVLSLWFILSRAGSPGIWTLALVYFAAAVPFFLAGTVVSIAISQAVEHVDRAYFFDLAGAAAGCLLLIPFLNLFGGPNTVLAAGAIYAISAAMWFHQAGGYKRRASAVGVGLMLVALMIVNGQTHMIDVRYAKGHRLGRERFSEWNSFSRVAVTRADVSWEKGAYWTIILDGDAGTGISQFDFSKPLPKAESDNLLLQGPGFPYFMRPGAKSLIVGPGGGYDIARALAGGSKDVTGVEINPIIANTIMRGNMKDISHGIYLLPEVHIAAEDGRSFIRRSRDRYQVLQATLVDTWASTAAGAFALSENNLYTSDAFYDYLSHLTDDGVLAFTRWGFDPPRESLRLVTLAMDALKRMGKTDPSRHILAVREDSARLQGYGALDTVLVSREPFTKADIERARDFLSQSHMEKIYMPGDRENAFGELLTSPNPDSFLASYPFDVSAVSDDRPFFFYTVQPKDFWNFVSQTNTKNVDYKVNQAVPMLVGVVGLSIVATLLVLSLPGVLLSSRIPKKDGLARFLVYFLCLGAAYVLIQVALIQKFVLLLGRPTYALTVIVLSMLLASGLGSYWSRRFTSNGGLSKVLIAAVVLLIALAFLSPPLTLAAAGWPLFAKLLLTAGVIAPAAFLMGMPFPAGLRRLKEFHEPAVRWAWSLNAAASVFGSALAILLAIYLGLRLTLLIGAGLYVCALLAISNREAST
jgi:hypothetical protein